MYLQTVLEVKKKERKTKTENDSTARYHSVGYFRPLPNFWYPQLHNWQVRLYCFYISKVSTPHERSNLISKPHIQSLHPEKTRVESQVMMTVNYLALNSMMTLEIPIGFKLILIQNTNLFLYPSVWGSRQGGVLPYPYVYPLHKK